MANYNTTARWTPAFGPTSLLGIAMSVSSFGGSDVRSATGTGAARAKVVGAALAPATDYGTRPRGTPL